MNDIQTMKKMNGKGLSVALLAALCLGGMTSCGWDDDYYYGGYSPYYGSSAWNSAWYDSSGYPIYGYSNGRPVYGYTSSGQAIYTLAGLGAGCFVPSWSPASWCTSNYHYVHNVVRTDRPRHVPADHRPTVRPPRPVSRVDNDRIFQEHRKIWNERKPGAAPKPGDRRPDFRRPEPGKPDAKKPGSWRPELNRPGSGKPLAGREDHHAQRPIGSTRPNVGADRPSRPGVGSNRPSRPEAGASRPWRPSFGSDRPSRPDAGASRPSRPSAGPSRPSRPDAGGARPPRPSGPEPKKS